MPSAAHSAVLAHMPMQPHKPHNVLAVELACILQMLVPLSALLVWLAIPLLAHQPAAHSVQQDLFPILPQTANA